tara:strand:+ start:386 stop:796 length:411 start_codon:yes stop_codon:yes gene_type:complete
MKAHGKIVDSEDLGVLASGHIFVVDSSGDLIEPATMETTDAEGEFSVEVMPKDSILISYVGYEDLIIPVSEFSSKRKEILLQYKSKANRMETQNREVDVEKGLLEKRRYGAVTWVVIGVAVFIIYKNWDKIKNYKI